MTTQLSAPPVLSTPETHIFEDPTPPSTTHTLPRYTDDELWDVYELERTAREIREGGYRRVALQFPDGMLRDAPRVCEGLEKAVGNLTARDESSSLETSFNELQVKPDGHTAVERVRFYILADTSYGSCCVDEIAAEHVNADVVVHYGRSCLSPTARLPVIYVFTTHPLEVEDVVRTFENTFPEKEEKVVLMADITYNNHIPSIREALVSRGYKNVLAPEVIHDPSSTIPNRKVDEGIDLKSYSLFHVSDPPDALLLTLSSRVKEMFIYPTTNSGPQTAIRTNTTISLRRRYALLTSLSTCPVFGILINTLSVKNYLSTATSIRSLISSAGKKSYTFVVGKINAAKIANFSEVGGWVVIGCWESSLVESGEFFRPVITPFELGLVLVGDGKRLWDGDWRGDFGGVEKLVESGVVEKKGDLEEEKGEEGEMDEDSEEESEPPEFDLRTGRYVSHSRPMRSSIPTPSSNIENESSPTAASNALTRRAKGDLATMNGAVSPGAEYLRTQRTWTGLGSDFHEVEAPQTIEEGRSGVARGYTVGEGEERR
ncbi:diphthamide biosynthesis protein [Mollisia scopiformis]|uniref:2-(3-amino-3-carboxypropyl)histidine synthase subunit 2 n=1 Tax=Mollisia scopiformis TaxID=149040 RepID=A0A132BB01_MOLSC|nr:diphthamide biosynthesis protein [Mollisia scopiformis]KUJ09600.1 diphthamide biosynthesis protein [Mollisia scopiformis]